MVRGLLNSQPRTMYKPSQNNLSAVALLVAVGCSGSSDGGEDCSEGKCDVANATKLATCRSDADFATETGALNCTPCANVLDDRSGRGFVPSFTANDALIKKVYMTFEDTNGNKKIDQAEITCPLDMPSIMAKLEKVDKTNCQGIATRVVSEDAARAAGGNANYRAVTSRNCDSRGEFGLLFSSFGFNTGSLTKTDHPGEVEIIAFDDVDGVFNYYKEIQGQMHFFGSSQDFVTAGPGGPSLTNTRGCANCHPGGGINMKELQSPWTHWSQNDNIVGADVLVRSRSAFMGTLRSGADMEGSVAEPGNDKWNISKAKFLSTVSTADLESARSKLGDDDMSSGDRADIARRGLKRNLNATQTMLQPLFCTVQVNINNSGGQSTIPSQIFMSNRSGLFGGPRKSFSSAELTAALTAIGSRVDGVSNNELTTPFMVLEPSHEDQSYINQLVALGVLDQGFVKDVLMIDFTRPVLSDDRCALLDLMPDLAPADRKVANIRDALIGALTAESPGAGSPAAQLLIHLNASKAGTPINFTTAVAKYAAACNARTAPTLVRDALKMRSLERQLAFANDGKQDDADGLGLHPFSVFEFENTMPSDNVTVSASAAADSATQVNLGARFSPNDCLLVSQYVAPTP